jgi:hypothetical protein
MMLRNSSDLRPGLSEAVEGHRIGRPDPDEIKGLTFDVPRRHYRLLLSHRQPEERVALRLRATHAAIAGLRRSFYVVVAVVTGEIEGEMESGSADIEDRKHLARSITAGANGTLAAGNAEVKGVHPVAGLIRLLSDPPLTTTASLQS